MSIAAEFGTGQVLWSILWFFLFVLFFWLIITVFVDLIRNDDLSGWGKALWTVGIIILPFLGIFLYLIVYGSSIGDRSAREAEEADAATQAYIRDVADTDESATEQLSTLADLHSAGKLTDDEYEQAKAKVVAG